MSTNHEVHATTPLPELPKRMMKIDEVAAYLDVPIRWVEDALQQRRIRHTRIGKHVRIAPAHVEELIAAGEQPVIARTECATPLAFHDRRHSRL